VAIRELVERGVPVAFELLGDEPPAGLDEVSDLPRLRYAIEDLGIAEHVQLLGPAPPEGVRDLLYRAHAFLHPSVAEGLPNVVLEAMACRLPVVVTDAGGTREAVQDSVEGFVVPPRDAHALADALDRLWRDESLRTRLGRAARARVEADFSLDDQTEAFEALYRELVGSQRRGAPRAPETVTDSAVS
jgi:colanic acid/amylovoran biosynthesis glycosyltransferase